MEVLGVSPHCGMCVPRQFQEPRKKKKKFFLRVVGLVIQWSREERPLLSLEIFWVCLRRQMSHKTDLGNIVSNNKKDTLKFRPF